MPVTMENDDFWNVALECYGDSPSYPPRFSAHNDDDDDNDDDNYLKNGEHDSSQGDDSSILTNRRGISRAYTLPLSPSLCIPTDRTVNYHKKDNTLPDASFTLKLSSLAETSGILSPLGSKAWHASALLAAYLLLPPVETTAMGVTPSFISPDSSFKHDTQDNENHSTNNNNQKHWCHHIHPVEHSSSCIHDSVANNHTHDGTNDNHKKNSSTFTVLELGSGAVGLSGISLGVALSRYFSFLGDATPTTRIRVILTDLEDDGIVDNLRRNVQENEASIQQACCWSRNVEGGDDGGEPRVGANIIPDIQVQALDWNDFRIHDETTSLQQQEQQHASPRPPTFTRLDWVVGSELVYTEETGLACAAVVSTLLQQHPNLVVFILQVLDRDGFLTHFIPTLEQQHYEVTIQQPLDATLHPVACDIVQSSSSSSATTSTCLGGTLDRFDYGACWIRNKNPK